MNEVPFESLAGPLIARAPSPGCLACVVIPVRDEAATLGASLRALANQIDLDGRPLDRSGFEVIVLANNCRDGSADLARRFAAGEPSLALHVAEVEISEPFAHVGTARRLLMDEACRRLLGLGRGRGVIVSTDGDTRVAPRWLAAIRAEVAAGAEAVGGDVRTDREGRASLGRPARDAYLVDVHHRRLVDELRARLDPDPADPWPRHHHHTGASLAVTAGAYRQVGGLPPLPTSEDLALVAALRRFDLPIRHSLDVRAITSARRLGRAGGGMADTLQRWSVAGPSFLVEHPAATEARAVLERRLRDFWKSQSFGHGLPELARSLDMDGPTLASMVEESPTFGLLLEAVGRVAFPVDVSGGGIDVSEAVAILRGRLRELRRVAPGLSEVSALLEEVEPVFFLPPPSQVA